MNILPTGAYMEKNTQTHVEIPEVHIARDLNSFESSITEVLQRVAGFCRVLQGAAGCCRVLQRTAVSWSVL